MRLRPAALLAAAVLAGALLAAPPTAADTAPFPASAAAAAEAARAAAGALYGGAAIDPGTGRLTVGVTGASAVGAVRATGADVRVVERGEDVLDGVAAALADALPADAGAVTGWYPDLAADAVVVTVAEGGTADADALVTAAGVDPGAVRVAEAAPPWSADAGPAAGSAAAQIVGGDPFATNGVVRCAIGFAVTTGFLTAAHCGEPGDTATGLSGGTGVFTAVAPSSGGALVTAEDDWEPTPYVRSGSGLVPVRGSREAPVGASVCRYGPATGVHCGVVQARNQTVVFPGGALHGLVRTSVCAEPGRADGPFLSGGQAQGVAVGGSGSCATGGTTFLAPVNPMLSQWGLTLATA